MLQVTAYISHLVSGLALLAGFVFIYTKFTPYDELQLIRKGNRAAAWSLGGALIGFCLTLASSILHNDTLVVFLAWAAGGMLVQLGVYVLLAHTIARVDQAIIDDNEAMGSLLGGVSIAVGIINAACMS
jgi:putative membrane protein